MLVQMQVRHLLSTNLAAIIAQTGRVCIIHWHWYEERLCPQTFSIVAMKNGLSDVLVGKTSPSDAVRKPTDAGFWIL